MRDKYSLDGVRLIADAIEQPGGEKAVNLRVAEQYIKEFGNLAKVNNTMIIPQSMTDLAGTIAAATSVIGTVKPESQETVKQKSDLKLDR